MNHFWEVSKKIVCVGRNYVNHAKELGNAVPTAPFFFLKPTTSYIRHGAIEIPPKCEVHHELELGVIIGKKGRDISEDEALDYVAGYTLALDLTARNIQEEAKKKGFPWTEAKGYDTFCPIGEFIPKEKIKDPSNLDMWLTIDGKTIQKGNTSQMIFNISKQIAHVSKIMTLEPGDLLLTGTPEGVGPIKDGNVLKAGLAMSGQQLLEMEFSVKNRTDSRL